MIRLRFEKAFQIFDAKADAIILPIKEIYEHKELIEKFGKALYGEIPAIIWNTDKTRQVLKELKALGLYNVVVENIGAVLLAKEFGFTMHGGFTLNVLNSVSLKEYEEMGFCDMTMSFELGFNKLRSIKADMPIGIVTYGYLPLMKFRSCPGRDEKGCGSCNGSFVMTDRMGENFRVVCRNKEYSELLNCVPLYVADKPVPKVDFMTLYFTIESKEECEHIYSIQKDHLSPEFRRTAGLYFRELQ